ADDEPTDRILSFRRTWHQQHENPPADVEPRDYVSLRRRNIRGYYGNITHADWAIGQILSCLEQEGIVEDTIIVYTTDHGDIACEHGILEKAPGINSDSVCRIPYIWSWPGHLPQGVERSQLVQAIDMWPTLTSLAGLSEMSMWDGRNITDCLMDERKKVHEAVFTENPFLKGITTERWRMIRVPEGMFPGDPIRGELYDRCKDPWERTNLFHSPTYSSIVQELTEKMLDWLITSHRPISALPVLPHPSVTWADDPMNDPKPHPEDGKTSPNQIWDCIRKGIDNYL
ncbi:MAG TPA: sulfatase-like hydrolase/transferase, partial [bacterium]|nr:sulfatase-like hydrolase/transferase [bacterium]